MRCNRWRYTCGACGTIYELPGADRSFHDGVFLGRSRNGQAVTLHSGEDPIFAQVEKLVIDHLESTDHLDLSQLVCHVIGVVCDPDRYGDTFSFGPTPGCPTCGSPEVSELVKTFQSWPEDPTPLRHYRWDTQLAVEQAVEVRMALINAGIPRMRTTL